MSERVTIENLKLYGVQNMLNRGSKLHPAAYLLSAAVLQTYITSTTRMTAREKFDFRRGFELGYYLGAK